MVTERACTKCGQMKPLVEFSAAPRGKHGRKASCKTCDAARHAALHPPKPRTGGPRRAPFTGDEEKVCRRCGEVKRLRNFSLARRAEGSRNAVYRSDCKACCSESTKRWFRDNPEKVHANKLRNGVRKYGLTADQFAELLESQGNACAICRATANTVRAGRTMRMSVDHCHDTGRVRGLLCNNCNRALGLFSDNPNVLRQAIRYLQKE